jgi:hypothetical protein
MKKQVLPKRFLSINGNPTQNSIIMYVIYLTNLPLGWDINKIHKPSVDKVREFFGVDYGFDVMIKWGISIDCSHSKTSKKRYLAMFKSFHDSKGLIGKGYVISDVKIK